MRPIDRAPLTNPPDFAVVDVSFISLKLVLPAALALLRTPASLLALIKPQFEAGRRRAKKGVVRDPCVPASGCEDIPGFLPSCCRPVTSTDPSGLPARHRHL